MLKKKRAALAPPFLFALLAGLLLAAGCAPGESPENRMSRENGGQRLVSLAPSVTETLVELGLGENIIGITRQDTQVKALPDAEIVGLYVRPNLERILALEPDFVFFDIYPGQEGTRRYLEERGIGVEAFGTRKIEDIFRMVERIGWITGREEEATALAMRMRESLEQARREAAGREKVPVYVEVGYNPIFTAGRDSYITEIIEAAGGKNIAAGIAGEYPRISPEFVISRQPGAIILPDMSGDWREMIEKRAGWEKIPAVTKGKIFSDADTHPLTIPSPGLLTETLPALSRFLAGG